MTEKFGTGRFCSKSCANSRKHSDESRIKTAKSLKKNNKLDFNDYIDGTRDLYLQNIVTYRNLKYYTPDKIEGVDFVLCPYCGARMSDLQVRHLDQHGKTKEDVKNEFGSDYQMLSQNTLNKRSESGKAVQQKLIDDGKHVGWQSRNIRSYAELFWEKVLDNNNIQYETEYVIKKRDLGVDDNNCYFLDFLIDGFIDLEIDGKQHKYEDRKISDEIRDELLINNGYIVYRIPWVNPKNKNNSDKVKQQIDDFLSWYNSVEHNIE